MDRALAAREYAGHLTDADLRLLAPSDRGDGAWLRDDPAALLRLLEDPGTFGTVLGEGPQGWAVQASPFLIFALLVQRAMTELASAAHVPERTGPRQRVPLFDAPALRDFLADTARRLFLAELLASFTRVASGRYRVRVAGRARTRRFSELDPVRLAGLLDAVPDAERPGVYRRLGDVSLFLTGVFPDYVTSRAFGPVDAGRLLRAAGLPAPASGSGWPPGRPSTCSSTSAPAGTGSPARWPRCGRRGWPWPATWPTGSGRPGGCSTTWPTGTCWRRAILFVRRL
jgi:hypothetical protein